MRKGCLNVYNQEQLKEFSEWIERKTFITPRGWFVDLSRFGRAAYIKDLPETGNYDPNWHDWSGCKGGEFGEQLMNPATFVAAWLYQNCPVKFVREWLEYAYDGQDNGIDTCKGTIDELTEPLKLPEFEPATKIKILKKGKSNVARDHFFVNRKGKKHRINVSGEYCLSIHDLNGRWFYYNSKMDHWILPGERDYKDTWRFDSKKSVKGIIKMILKKWKLPKNAVITLSGGKADRTFDWKLITK